MKSMRRVAANYTGLMLVNWLAAILFLIHGNTCGALLFFVLAGAFSAWTYSAWSIYGLYKLEERQR